MPKQKFYVVWIGRKPGIYMQWDECSKQIFGFPEAKYKSFENKAEAEAAFKKSYKLFIYKKTDRDVNGKKNINNQSFIKNSIAADAACSGNPGPMEYRIVETWSGKELYRSPVYPNSTVNIGEFLAIVHSLALLKKCNSNLPVYSDSKTAIKWVKDKKIKTTLVKDERNVRVFELIENALNWLNINSWSNPVLKWETSSWGEIPADFGRK